MYIKTSQPIYFMLYNKVLCLNSLEVRPDDGFLLLENPRNVCQIVFPWRQALRACATHLGTSDGRGAFFAETPALTLKQFFQS